MFPVSILIWVESLRFAEPRGPDASPREGRTASFTGRLYPMTAPPGHLTRPKAQPILCSNSVGFGLRAPGVGRTAQRASPAVLRTAKARPTARPSAARKPQPVFAPEEQSRPKAQPNSPPRVRLTAAPLSLRHVCRRPRQFLPDWPSANRQNMPSLAGGRRVFRG